MSRPGPDDRSAARERRQVDLAKGRRDLRPDTAPVRPDTRAWVPSPAPTPPVRRRSRRVGLLVVAAAVVAAVVTTFLLWPAGTTPPGTPAAASSVSSSPSSGGTVALTATDRLLRAVSVGKCLAMTDRLDDETDPATAVVPCTSAAATFTVTEVNQKLKARAPCRSDTFIRSRAVGRVACLDRYLQRGQCILGNGAQRFLISAVACDTEPVTPFSEVFRIQTLDQTGQPVVCAPPLVLQTATPNRSMCLAKVS